MYKSLQAWGHGGWRRTREVKTEIPKKVNHEIGASCIKLQYFPLFVRGCRHHTSLEKNVELGLTKSSRWFGDLASCLWSGSEDKRPGSSWKRLELFDAAMERFLQTPEGQRDIEQTEDSRPAG